MYNEVKDSGKKQEFDTGSMRDTEDGKGDFSLLPWIALRRFAIHLQNGAKKYTKHNWRKGQNVSRYFSAAIRHLMKWWLCWDDEDHLAAVLFNVSAIVETEEMVKRGKLPEKLLDRIEEYADDYSWENPVTVEHIDYARSDSTTLYKCSQCYRAYSYDKNTDSSYMPNVSTSGLRCPFCHTTYPLTGR